MAWVMTGMMPWMIMGCSGGDGEDSAASVNPAQRPQPVALVTDEDQRPAPEVLADIQVLHRGNGEEPQSLDPHLSEGIPSGHILRDLFEGLTTTAADGSVVPGVAESWRVSRDGKTYRFTLREDARWSNGEPLTAEDFVWSLRRSVDPATASAYSQILSPILNAEAVLSGAQPPTALAVRAPDARTLEIELGAPTAYFLQLLTHSSTYPVHRATLEAHGSQWTRPGNMVSNGAFSLTDWRVRSLIRLDRNPEYHGADEVLLETVYFYPIDDQSAEFKRYRAGELHWTYDVPNNQFRWLATHLPEELAVHNWLGTYFFGFNLTRPPFEDNLYLRQALAMAIDRPLITEKVTQFGEQATLSLVPDGIGAYEPQVPEWADLERQERLELARELYRRGGYSEDRPLTLELRYNTNENHKKVALAVAAMWKQNLGVNTILLNEEWKVFLQNRAQKAVTQVFRAGWIGDFADPYSFLQLFHSEHGRNDYGYSNARYDRLLDTIAEERIDGRRRRLMEEAERSLMADQPIIPVYVYVTKRLVDPRLRGWHNNIMDQHPSRHMFLLRTLQPEAAADEPAADGMPEDQETKDEAAEEGIVEDTPAEDTLADTDGAP